MSETNHDKGQVAETDFSPWVMSEQVPIVEPRRVLLYPQEHKGYRILIGLSNVFTLAAVIAWFVLLVSLICLVISLLNSVETLNTIHDQEASFSTTDTTNVAVEDLLQ